MGSGLLLPEILGDEGIRLDPLVVFADHARALRMAMEVDAGERFPPVYGGLRVEPCSTTVKTGYPKRSTTTDEEAKQKGVGVGRGRNASSRP